MCRVLEVSTSGFYESLKRPPSQRAERSERIREAVRQVHAESHGTYGSEKIAIVLEKQDGLERACVNTVKRAMREMGLKGRVSKAAFKLSISTSKPATHQHFKPRHLFEGCVPRRTVFFGRF